MAQFKIESTRKASLVGEVSETEEDSALVSVRAFFDSLAAGQSVEIDLAQLGSFHSVALSLLLSVMRIAEKASCSVVFSNLPQKMFDVARVGGLDDIIPQSHA